MKKSHWYGGMLKTSVWLELGSRRHIHDPVLRSMDMYQGMLILNTVAVGTVVLNLNTVL